MTTDGGAAWTFGGNFWDGLFGDDAGHASVVCDGTGTFFMPRLLTAGGAMLSRGRFTGDAFAWAPEVPLLVAPGPRQQHPLLVYDPTSGALYFTYTRVPNFANSLSAVFFTRSLDGGASWSTPVGLSADSCTGGRVVVGPDGGLTAIWVDETRNLVLCRRSVDQGATFSSPHVVAAYNDNINTLPPGEELGSDPNARYPLAQTFPNYPALVVDRSSGPYRGRLYAAWVQQADGVADPLAGGLYESEPNDTPSQANTFPVGYQINGNVISSNIGPSSPDYWAFEGQAGQTISITGEERLQPAPIGFTEAGYSLYFCGPDSALVQLPPIVTTNPSAPLPPTVFTLPNTGRYVIGVFGAGPYTNVYNLQVQNYAVSPFSASRDHRDVVLTWSDDGGATWAPLRRGNDSPVGFTDALPELLVDERGWVHLAWYDFREDPSCGALAGVYWRMSSDGGQTFQPSQRITSQPSTWVSGLDYATVGDHLALATQGANLHVMWTDMRDQMATSVLIGSEIYTAHFLLDATTATEASLAAFAARAEADGVHLTWRVDGVEQVRGFEVERAEGAGEFGALLLSMPTPGVQTDYEATDASAQPGHTYRYRTAIVLADGSRRWSEPVSVSVPGGGLAWGAMGPNPFGSELALALANPREEAVEVTVHDLQGARVATLHRGSLAAGLAHLSWNGRRADGSAAPAGIYLVRATAAAATVTRRVVRVR